MLRFMAQRREQPAVQPGRPSDDDREQAIDRLKQSYATGSIDHDELQRRIEVVLVSPTTAILAAAVADLHAPVLRQPQRDRAALAVVGLGTAALLSLLGVGALATPSEPQALEYHYCESVGMGVEGSCPELSDEQLQIRQQLGLASSAATAAMELLSYDDDEVVLDAANDAEEARVRAYEAEVGAQEIVANLGGQQVPEGALDEAIEDARSAADEAVKALQEAQAAFGR